jgi:hypothetical protein
MMGLGQDLYRRFDNPQKYGLKITSGHLIQSLKGHIASPIPIHAILSFPTNPILHST